MTTRISFNAWLSLQKADPNIGALASAWKTTRGRLTRDAVEKRAQIDHGQRAGVGWYAYDAYCDAVGIPRCGPPLPASPDEVSASIEADNAARNISPTDLDA